VPSRRRCDKTCTWHQRSMTEVWSNLFATEYVIRTPWVFLHQLIDTSHLPYDSGRDKRSISRPQAIAPPPHAQAHLLPKAGAQQTLEGLHTLVRLGSHMGGRSHAPLRVSCPREPLSASGHGRSAHRLSSPRRPMASLAGGLSPRNDMIPSARGHVRRGRCVRLRLHQHDGPTARPPEHLPHRWHRRRNTGSRPAHTPDG
jgi:hypothetical protein